MLDKLSFEQLAKFYGSLSDLEKVYGVGETRKGIEAMAKLLDDQQRITATEINAKYIKSGNGLPKGWEFDDNDESVVRICNEVFDVEDVPEDQIKMELPFEPMKEELEGGEIKKRKYYKRKPHGYNEAKIGGYCNVNFPELSTESAMLSMYYQGGLTQRQIADEIGIDQRAISMYLNGIPEQRKRTIMSGWSK